tara:strand:- start:7917 stop:8744 length:828 start_codon:yes stop_codon:yes gene_type:complete
MQLIRELTGNSGCKIHLFLKNEVFFVRKTSKDINYNERLVNQFHKQVSFNNLKVKTPVILEAGYSGGLFYMDMEYTSGLPLNDFVTQNHPRMCSKIISLILQRNQSCKFTPNTKKLKNKIKTIASQLVAESSFSTNLVKECHKKLTQLYDKNWSNLDLSFCHGDLTFENVIIRDNEVYLIDFLDSFVDNHLLDASKLIMDLIIGWSWRYSDNIPYVKNSLILSNIYKLYPDKDVDLIHKFIFLHLLRMYPYTSCLISKNKIELGLSYCLDNFNFK